MKSDETKEKIIHSTIQLLEEEGYRGATTQAICKKAQISQGRINYHFGSKNELLLRIAEIMPRQARIELDKLLDEKYKCDLMMKALFFDALIIRIMYTDNKYMKIYRELYSQDFVCSSIAKMSEEAYRSSYFKDMEIGETMAIIMANANAYSITSLGQEQIYEKMKNDVDKVLRGFLRYQMMIFPMEKKEKKEKIDIIINFVNSLEYEIHGIADVRFIN